MWATLFRDSWFYRIISSYSFICRWNLVRSNGAGVGVAVGEGGGSCLKLMRLWNYLVSVNTLMRWLELVRMVVI